MSGGADFRWRLDDEGATLFDLGYPERHVGRGEYRGLEFLHVKARTIVNQVPASSRMAFRYTINPYRGCSHACVYCFARPTHEYLGLGIGEDFERRIVVKVNAVELAKAELSSPRWRGDLVAMGTNTDPYQHAEGKYHLTKGIIGALSERRNPFSILTKSTLVLRDIELLSEAARHAHVQVNLSIGTLDREVWKATEPGTPPPDRRLEAVRRLNQAGVPCGVLIAPVLPGLSDSTEQVTEVAGACKAAGANVAGVVALHLRPGVREHYLAWLGRARPESVGLYTERFARGSYQPKAEQERLSALVRAVFAGGGARGVTGGGVARGRRGPRAAPTEHSELPAAPEPRRLERAARAPGPTPAPAAAETYQLALFSRG